MLWNEADVGYQLAVKYQIKKFDKFLELYKQQGAWLAPAMGVMILDMRMLAKRADFEVGDTDNGFLVEAKRLLDSCFRYTIMVGCSILILCERLKDLFVLGTRFDERWSVQANVCVDDHHEPAQDLLQARHVAAVQESDSIRRATELSAI